MSVKLMQATPSVSGLAGEGAQPQPVPVEGRQQQQGSTSGMFVEVKPTISDDGGAQPTAAR